MQIKTTVESDLTGVLPTLVSCIGSSHLKVKDRWENSTIFLSRLLGRFECVARSKDFNPMKPSSWSVQKVLKDTVKSLEEEWARCIVVDIKEQEINSVEVSARSYINITHGQMTLRIIDSRWLDALRYVCSYQYYGAEIIEAAVPRCEIMETSGCYEDGLC